MALTDGPTALGSSSDVGAALGRSRWQLSATNTSGGLEVEVFQEGDNSPTYSTMLSNHRVKRNIERKTIDTRMLAPLIAKGSR